MNFRKPFYVSPHAVQRFKERVADLPTKTIRIIIQAALQDNRQQVGVQIFNHRPCPVFKSRYLDKEYLIPVLPEEKKVNGELWPVVPTVLLPGMETKIFKERRGWKW